MTAADDQAGPSVGPAAQVGENSDRRLIVRNLVNAPFELPSLQGILILPALGETEPARFSEEQELVMSASLALELSEVRDVSREERKASGSTDEDKSALVRLRGEYSELTGKKPFHGWNALELQKRIDAALAA